MKKIFSTAFTMALVSLLFSSFVFIQGKKVTGPLDGKKFTILLVQGGKKEIPDEMSFTSGKCKTTYFTKEYEFPAKLYDVTYIDSTNTDKRNYEFTWESMNEWKEKIALTATIEGDEIEGTAEVVGKKGKTTKTYTFTGKLKKKKGAK